MAARGIIHTGVCAPWRRSWALQMLSAAPCWKWDNSPTNACLESAALAMLHVPEWWASMEGLGAYTQHGMGAGMAGAGGEPSLRCACLQAQGHAHQGLTRGRGKAAHTHPGHGRIGAEAAGSPPQASCPSCGCRKCRHGAAAAAGLAPPGSSHRAAGFCQAPCLTPGCRASVRLPPFLLLPCTVSANGLAHGQASASEPIKHFRWFRLERMCTQPNMCRVSCLGQDAGAKMRQALGPLTFAHRHFVTLSAGSAPPCHSACVSQFGTLMT